MIKYLKKVKEIMVQIQSYKVQQISRLENARANILAMLAMSQMADLSNDAHLETLETRSIEETDAILCTALEPSWMDLIIKYLKSRKLPNDPIVAQKVKHQASRYILIEKKII